MMKSLSPRFPSLVISILCAVLLAGCSGETQLDVVKPFRSQYQAFAKQLNDLADMDPKTAFRPTAPLDPKPTLRNSAGANTAIFKFEQLRDPYLGLKKPLFLDPHLSDRVLTQLRIGLSPDDQLKRKGFKGLRDDLNQALQVRYIGAIRIAQAKAPVVVGADGFEGGNATGVAILFDRQTMKPVFAEVFNAQTDAEVSYTHRKDEKPTAAGLQSWLDSNLAANVKKAALKKFAEGTGGVFDIGTP